MTGFLLAMTGKWQQVFIFLIFLGLLFVYAGKTFTFASKFVVYIRDI